MEQLWCLAGRPDLVVPVPMPALAPHQKPKRVLNVASKNEILNYRRKHSLTDTLGHFPEASESAIKRAKKDEKRIRDDLHAGRGLLKMRQPLKKHKALGEKLNEFFPSKLGMPKEQLPEDFLRNSRPTPRCPTRSDDERRSSA